MPRPRQPNGSSSIRKRADGKYHTEAVIGEDEHGEQIRKHVKRRTAAAVLEHVKELQERTSKGIDVTAPIDSLAEWADHWLKNVILVKVRSGKLAHSTYVDYRKMVRNHIRPELGNWQLVGRRKRLEPEHVDLFYATRAEKGLAGSYIVKMHVVLSSMLRMAYRRGKADRNVMDLVDEPEFDAQEVDPLTPAEATAVLQEALKDELAARWIIGIIQGPRQGDTLGIRWPQVDLDPVVAEAEPHIKPGLQLQRRGWEHGCKDPVECARPHCRTKPCPIRYIHGCPTSDPCGKKLTHFCPDRLPDPVRRCSRHATQDGKDKDCPPLCEPECTRHAIHCESRWGGGLVMAKPKTRKTGREPIALAGITVELLRLHREKQIQEYAEHGFDEWDKTGYVFIRWLGDRPEPIDPRVDYANWQALMARAGVKPNRLHAARHTAGTMLRATGSDLKMIIDVLRQAKLESAQPYVKTALTARREAVDRVAAALLDGDLSMFTGR